MIGHRPSFAEARGRFWRSFSIAACLITAGCSGREVLPSAPPAVLRIGFGLSTGQNEVTGLRPVIGNLTSEGLLTILPNGRPEPWLAQSWTRSDDGRTLRIQLRPNASFHDGKPVDATAVTAILMRGLPGNIGAAFADVDQIVALSTSEVEIRLKQRSNFVLEGLDLPVTSVSGSRAATGPFLPATENGAQVLLRNERYYGEKAIIERIIFRPYRSVRAAWADSLRGDVDMLYDVGQDAVGSLEGSTQTNVFNVQRPYTYLVVLNVHSPVLKSKETRQRLNAAIDRSRLVAQALGGHGTPASSPVWPKHWAYDERRAGFTYNPSTMATSRDRLQFTCIFAEASLERLGLAVQSQLSDVGVDMKLQMVSIDEFVARTNSGDFDAMLGDIAAGPMMVRPTMFWSTGAIFNWGRYSNPLVDAAFAQMNHAANDEAYRAGFAAYQKALVDDPPAIFLAWSERARAVSSRFEVPVEPGRDILRTLRRWRPVAPPPAQDLN